MFRMISLLKRKSGLTHEQFREYYETHHRPIGEGAVAGYALSYERYYLYAMTSDGAPPSYDAVTQLCFPNRDAYDRCVSAVMTNPEKARMVIEDEQKFFDRETSPNFEAQDSCSKLQALPASATVFRTVWFARHRPGMTHEQCRDYYENKHRLIGEYLMNGYAYNYDRHFLYRLAPDAPNPYYTFIMEMNFPSRARYEEMVANIVTDRTISQFIAEDEARFIDRASAMQCTAEVSTSVLAPLAADSRA